MVARSFQTVTLDQREKTTVVAAHRRAPRAAPLFEEIAGDGWTLREDRDDNRLLIGFAQKPPREMLAALRSAGFVYSPTRGAHVRMMSNGAVYAAKRVLGIV